MDFRFNFNQLFGAKNTFDQKSDVVSCPLTASGNCGLTAWLVFFKRFFLLYLNFTDKTTDLDPKMIIDEEEVVVDGVDRMWKYEPGKCDSSVTRLTDENEEDWIEVKKTLSFGEKADITQNVLDTVVYLEVQFAILLYIITDP